MEGKKKTAIYLRISVEDTDSERSGGGQEESVSITSQRKYLLEYIKKDKILAGSEILEFCDDGFTGTNMSRPGMQEMLKQVRQNKIGCILVKDLSRFSRDYIETGTYLNQIFPFMGVEFIAINDRYDSRENGGSIALDTAFQTLLYDLYSKDISIKVKTSFDNKCANGEYVFGQVPFGYEKSREVKNKVIINDKEAEIVRYIFSMAAEGMSSGQIAKRLFEERIPTAMQMRYPERQMSNKNHTWSSTVVRSILDNRFYLGEMSYGKSKRRSVGSKSGMKVPKSDWKVVENHHEPLVTPEIFSRVMLELPGHSTKRKREKHPLTGKIYCGGCGYSLNYKPERNGNNQRFFWCRKHALLQIPDCCTYYNAVILEETVLTLLNHELMRRGDVLKQGEALEQFQKETLEGLSRKNREYKKQYSDIQKEKDLLYESYVAGGITVEEYRSRADSLAGQLEELEGKIAAIEADENRMREELHKSKEDMKQIIRYAHMKELTQEAVDIFIRKVTVYKGKKVEIAWNFQE